MNLVVISSCAHIQHQGALSSFEPFVLEMNVIAELFDRVTLIVPTQQVTDPPPFWAAYADLDKITVVSYKADRGMGLLCGENSRTGVGDVLRMLRALWMSTSRKDAIHVRLPSGIGLPALLFAPLLTSFRFAKYAGQWNDVPEDRLAIKLQKRLLASCWWKAPVTVYGNWPKQPAHIISFFTSMMTREMVRHATLVAAAKCPGSPFRVLFSGRLAPEKRVSEILLACRQLQADGFSFMLRIVGDGPERKQLEAQTETFGLTGRVAFLGHLPFDEAIRQNEWADALVLPSRHSEGWPKAVAEAMCHGVVCIAVDHGQIGEMLHDRGVLLPTGTAGEISGAIETLAANRRHYQDLSQRAAAWGRGYSLEGLQDALRTLLEKWWQVTLGTGRQG